MLVRFKATNWKSFPLLEFSAIANRGKKHGERVPKISSFRTRILPIAAIYGGNASGKTNFFDALYFMKRYVVDGIKPSKPIGVKPFALNAAALKEPVGFEIEILVGTTAYRYAFAATKTEVVSESLTEIRPQSEIPLFSREKEDVRILAPKWATNDKLRFVGEGTQKNLLFLTNSVLQKCDEFRRVYDWFDKTLVFVAPESTCDQYEMFANLQSPFQPKNQETLDRFDVGIEKIETVDVPWSQVPLPQKFKTYIEDNLPDGSTFQISPFLIKKENDETRVKKMVATHSSEDDPSKKIQFELADESDGTRRLLDLIPTLTLLCASEGPRVVFIDEIDQSLHHLATKQLVETYLDNCSEESRSQLFFTTHDVLLMDQSLLRRDEMRLVDKRGNRSEMISLGDFNLRYDKDLINSYLFGRFGGVPRVW